MSIGQPKMASSGFTNLLSDHDMFERAFEIGANHDQAYNGDMNLKQNVNNMDETLQ